MAFVEEYVATKGLDWLLKGIPVRFKKAMRSLHEVMGREPPVKFPSVSSFWYEGVDLEGLSGGASVSIDGVVSPYVPINPLHPSAVPGRQIERWLPARAPVDDFAHEDFLFWNDGIVALPQTRSRKGFLSINDKYGLIGRGSVPAIIDLNTPHLKAAYDQVMSRRPASLECTAIGRLVDFQSPEIKALWNDVRREEAGTPPIIMPTYVLEVSGLTLGKAIKHLNGMVWIGASNRKVIPIYCDISNFQDHAKAVAALGALFQPGECQPVAVYDPAPITSWPGPIPPLNEELQESVRDL